jgi:Tol biopolymer transport system component
MPENFSFARDNQNIAVSPDGGTFVFTARGATAEGPSLFLRAGNATEAIAIPGTVGANNPVFSPDGKWIAFRSRAVISKVRLDGFGSPSVVSTRGQGLLGWVGNETFLVSRGQGLAVLTTAGNTVRTLTVPDSARGERDHRFPVTATDGKTVFFTIRGTADAYGIGVVSLEGGPVTRLGVAGEPLGVIDAYLIYMAPGKIFAVRYDFGRRTVVGTEVQIADSVISAKLSRSGTLFAVRGAPEGNVDVISVSLDGARKVLIPSVRHMDNPRYSPNGRRIAFNVPKDSSSEVWVYDLVSRTFDPLVHGANTYRPEWTFDGKRILFVNAGRQLRNREVWWKAADGTGDAERLFAGPGDIGQAFASRDGRWLVYRLRAGDVGEQFWYRGMSGDTTPHLLLPARDGVRARSPELSTDGRCRVYVRRGAAAASVRARLPGLGWALSGLDQRWPAPSLVA